MHILQAIVELFFMTYETIPKRMLPEGSPAASESMKSQRRDLLHGMQHLPHPQRIPCPDQSLPVVWHQHLATP